jgi:hypothetical protein
LIVSAPTGAKCDNCGAALVGDYCHQCGAPELSHRDLSFRGFMGELAEVFTSLEHSKVLRTLGALLFRPGLLTREYFTGRRVRYIRPLTLCLTILALHLFAYSASKHVTMFDIGRTASQSDKFARSRGLETGTSLAQMIERQASRVHTPVLQLEGRINDRWARNMSLFQIPLIVLFALVLQLAYLRSSRFLIEHFTFSTHYISFQALLQVVMWPFYYLVGIGLSGAAILVAVTTNAVSLIYLCAAVRGFYGDSFKQALVRGPLLYLGYLVIYVATYQIAMTLALRSMLR